MTWWWPFGHLWIPGCIIAPLSGFSGWAKLLLPLAHLPLILSQGRCLLKLPDTGNQELLQNIHSWNQQVIYRELGDAHKETAIQESHPCALSWASTEQSPDAEIKRIPASITLSGTIQLHCCCIFNCIHSVLFPPLPFISPFLHKRKLKPQSKAEPGKPHNIPSFVCEQLLNSGLAGSPNRQNSFHCFSLCCLTSPK